MNYEAISVTYSECVSVFLPSLSGIQIAPYLHRIILCSVACLVVHYFSVLFHNQQDFQGKNLERKTSVLIFSTSLSETFLILRRVKPDVIINVSRSSMISTRYSSQSFTLKFLCRISKSPQISNLMKIRFVGAELLNADGQTDGQTSRLGEANSRFTSFLRTRFKRDVSELTHNCE